MDTPYLRPPFSATLRNQTDNIVLQVAQSPAHPARFTLSLAGALVARKIRPIQEYLTTISLLLEPPILGNVTPYAKRLNSPSGNMAASTT